MRGIEPLMPVRCVFELRDDMPIPKHETRACPSRCEALFDLVHAERLYALAKAFDPAWIELEQSGSIERLDRLVALPFLQLAAPVSQPPFVLSKRRALLFYRSCHEHLLVHADRAAN
ncbi:MAG: hypothetical protein BGP17_13885 [Sphingomonas sp. 67-41]|nr:MAG: hypothetical protein BGP17_13885 [Sphingomonas sp. 67-41]